MQKNAYLRETEFLNFTHPEFRAFIDPFCKESASVETAIKYYQFIRDHFLYDPFHLDLRKPALQASSIILKNRAWCVEKAIVFAAGLRAMGIPAKLGYAIVENHIGVERLTQILKSPKIVFHGYVEVFIKEFNQWTKATPAFDQRVCKLSHVEPLTWDGKQDSLFQAYMGTNKFMLYHHDYGTFDDVPRDLMQLEMSRFYPHLFDGSVPNTKKFSFYFE